jgi:hypothetical protein
MGIDKTKIKIEKVAYKNRARGVEKDGWNGKETVASAGFLWLCCPLTLLFWLFVSLVFFFCRFHALVIVETGPHACHPRLFLRGSVLS